MKTTAVNVVTLDAFIKEAHASVDKFEAMWRANNKTEPDCYPMTLPEENAGVWWEQLTTLGE